MAVAARSGGVPRADVGERRPQRHRERPGAVRAEPVAEPVDVSWCLEDVVDDDPVVTGGEVHLGEAAAAR